MPPACSRQVITVHYTGIHAPHHALAHGDPVPEASVERVQRPTCCAAFGAGRGYPSGRGLGLSNALPVFYRQVEDVPPYTKSHLGGRGNKTFAFLRQAPKGGVLEVGNSGSSLV